MSKPPICQDCGKRHYKRSKPFESVARDRHAIRERAMLALKRADAERPLALRLAERELARDVLALLDEANRG